MVSLVDTFPGAMLLEGSLLEETSQQSTSLSCSAIGFGPLGNQFATGMQKCGCEACRVVYGPTKKTTLPAVKCSPSDLSGLSPYCGVSCIFVCLDLADSDFAKHMEIVSAMRRRLSLASAQTLTLAVMWPEQRQAPQASVAAVASLCTTGAVSSVINHPHDYAQHLPGMIGMLLTSWKLRAIDGSSIQLDWIFSALELGFMSLTSVDLVSGPDTAEELRSSLLRCVNVVYNRYCADDSNNQIDMSIVLSGDAETLNKSGASALGTIVAGFGRGLHRRLDTDLFVYPRSAAGASVYIVTSNKSMPRWFAQACLPR
jgi:hypothetical protein